MWQVEQSTTPANCKMKLIESYSKIKYLHQKRR